MTHLKERHQEDLVDEFIDEAEDSDIGFFRSYWNIIKQISLVNLIKGFFGGFGGFFGSLLCYYYILPYLKLQDYTWFTETLLKH